MQDPGRSGRERVLVIDDDPQTSELIRSWFKSQEFEILAAPDGEKGLELAHEGSPDLILLDLRMPGLDGFAVARRLKHDRRTRAIPLILLTACREVDAKTEAFSAGVDDYVTKPFDMQEVEARIRANLRKRRLYLGLESKVRDLSETNTQLEKLLMVDEKTGLFNFREFQRRLCEEWERAARYGTPLSLVFFDLDHFKQINDTVGHPAGDKVLREFAVLLTGGARANDVATRYGGEEFALILPHTDGEMAERVAERIRAAVQEFVFLEDESPVRMTVSSGIATFPSQIGIDTIDELIRASDRALYDAKEKGRNRVERDRLVGDSGTPDDDRSQAARERIARNQFRESTKS